MCFCGYVVPCIFFTDSSLFASHILYRYATSLDHTEDGDTAVIHEFLETTTKGQCKELMVKMLDGNINY